MGWREGKSRFGLYSRVVIRARVRVSSWFGVKLSVGVCPGAKGVVWVGVRVSPRALVRVGVKVRFKVTTGSG